MFGLGIARVCGNSKKVVAIYMSDSVDDVNAAAKAFMDDAGVDGIANGDIDWGWSTHMWYYYFDLTIIARDETYYFCFVDYNYDPGS